MHEPLELTARNKCDAATRGFCLTLLPNLMPHHCGSLEGLGISTSSVMFGQCAALCLYKCAPIAYQKECIYMMFIDILIYIYIRMYMCVCVCVCIIIPLYNIYIYIFFVIVKGCKRYIGFLHSWLDVSKAPASAWSVQSVWGGKHTCCGMSHNGIAFFFLCICCNGHCDTTNHNHPT